MKEAPEGTARIDSEVPRSGLTPEQPEVEIQDLLFSETVSSISYWGTILLLAVVGAYLIRWEIGHAAHYVAPANDLWGITTPPWLVALLAPVGTVLSLAHAVWSALRGQRAWRTVMTASTLILLLASNRLLDAFS
jgi:hypothetical protein